MILFPLLGGFTLAVVGRYVPRRTAEWISCLSVLASFLMAVVTIVAAGERSYTFTFLNWISVGSFTASMSVYYDRLAAVMTLMVTFVSSLIHLYSVSFMRDEEDYVRYFCYLNLFVFSMLVITLADNLVFLYLGWEGVGFCSYILIGYWYADEAKAAAGRKAFLLTRIGDVAFGIAIAIFFAMLSSLSIKAINLQAQTIGPGAATLLGLLILWAAVGKSAQLPLLVWLPDAMAGPSPVSALIHAATMVTAGVYLLMRLFPVLSLSPMAMLTVAIVAAVTSLFAALAALGQRDIKRILAYSTISQVSYMFLGVGVGDVTASMYHLLSHAFFKALLFLGAGCVIQALHEEHDIFKMGDLRRRLPSVYWLFLAGAVSLAAIPPFGGFFSKDRILFSALSHPGLIYKILFGIGEAAALLTVLYTFRMFFVAFTGKAEKETPIADLPGFMIWIISPLALLSVIAAALNFPAAFGGSEWLSHYLSPVPGGAAPFAASPGVERGVEIGCGALNVAALILAYSFYRPPRAWAAGRSLEEVLLSGFYLDRFYQVTLVKPFEILARVFWLRVDEGGIDDRVDGTGVIFRYFSIGLQLWATGRLSTYLRMVLLGFTVIISLLAIKWFSL
jgi:NADH-quinone oxidoreductase subunit L